MAHSAAYTTLHEIDFINALSEDRLREYARAIALRSRWGDVDAAVAKRQCAARIAAFDQEACRRRFGR